MKMQVFSIYDKKMQCFAAPFYQVNKGTAMRSFGDHVCDAKSNLCAHADDYALYYLGTYDDATGKFVSNEVVQLVCEAVDFVNQKKSEV